MIFPSLVFGITYFLDICLKKKKKKNPLAREETLKQCVAVEHDIPHSKIHNILIVLLCRRVHF